MNLSANSIKKNFSKELHRSCVNRYQVLPSNEQLSRDLHVFSKYTRKVSRETVRKWLRGETFPDLDCLLHLIDWLKLDMTNIFPCNSPTENNQVAANSQKLITDPNVTLSTHHIDMIIELLIAIKKSEILDPKMSIGRKRS